VILPEAPLTREQVLEGLKEMREMDAENGHLLADEILLRYINDKEITKLFKQIEKWYS